MMDLGKPESIEKIKSISNVTYTRKNFTPAAFFLLFFCIAWDSFLFFWYFGAPSSSMGLIGKIFPIAHVAVGLGLSYYTLTLFINKIIINISLLSNEVTIKDTPLPLGNSKKFIGTDFKQFYVNEKITRNENSSNVSYTLMGITKKGDSKKIIKSLNTKEEGLYLEQEFEKLFRITHEDVKGAVNN